MTIPRNTFIDLVIIQPTSMNWALAITNLKTRSTGWGEQAWMVVLDFERTLFGERRQRMYLKQDLEIQKEAILKWPESRAVHVLPLDTQPWLCYLGGVNLEKTREMEKTATSLLWIRLKLFQILIKKKYLYSQFWFF